MIYFASELLYRFYAYINFILSQAWLWQLLLSRFVASQSVASLHLYWDGILLVHPTPENQVTPKSPL
jgi:hypothetical protein